MPASVEIGEVPIGVFRIGGTLHAIETSARTLFARLSKAMSRVRRWSVRYNAALFHVPTGECRRGPADRDLETYEVKVEDGSVYVLA